MKVLTLLLLCSAFGSAQISSVTPVDALDLARMKNYISGRVSSGNRFVASNDDSKRVMPGETLVMADLQGTGMITHIWLTVADNEFAWQRLIRLRVYYDGHKTPSVDVPLGDFFAVGHGSERPVDSAMIHNASLGRARNSYWPMPFRRACRITVTNEGKRMLPMFYYHVDYRKYASLPADVGYFHAYYRQERPARAGHNYEFLHIKGNGHYVGTVLNVIQTQVSWFGEGDDLFYVDGAAKPQILGTGSEDYFNDAWGLRDSSSTWTGTPLAEGEKLGSRLSAFRWHIPDPIPFHHSIWAGIEHAGWTANPDGSVRSGFEQRPDFFSSIALWYQQGVNEGMPEPPYGYQRLPFGNAQQLTVQNALPEVTTENGKASVAKEVDWAKDLLVLDAAGAGAKINIPIDIVKTGRYELIGLIAQGPDYGDYTALMDGTPMNVDPRQAATSEVPQPGPEIYYGYLPEVYVAKDQALGMVNLTQGRHILTFVCTGKDPRSVSYKFGLNDVVLERLEEEPANANDVSDTSFDMVPEHGIVYRGRTLEHYLKKARAASTDSDKARVFYQLGEFGPDGTGAVPLLRDGLRGQSTDVRAAVITSLGKIGAADPKAIQGLMEALGDQDSRIRGLSALALKSIGPKSAVAVTRLSGALDDPVESVRVSAAEAWGEIGPPAGPAAHALARKIVDKKEGRFVFRESMLALGKIGPNAKDALPELREVAGRTGPESLASQTILLIEGKKVPEYY
jgi:HEAT repeat protein